MQSLFDRLDDLKSRPLACGPMPHGRILSCEGGLIEVTGLQVPIGTMCRIVDGGESAGLAAEVIGFRRGHSLMTLLGDTVLLQPDSAVRAEGTPGMVGVGEAFLGRAVDGCGQAIDGGPKIRPDALWPLAGVREGALERASVSEPFDSGVRAINALATMGIGQRMGILAGSGVGKSVLIDMIADGAEADIVVVGLIGERAREVSDFVARHLTGDTARRTAIVAVPADHAANLRLRGSQFACALAEHFRARGKKVLLIMDSLTRVAHAAREIALLTGEPGAARGYPPSALATITRLVERAGNSTRTNGAITGLYTVLADGDDTNDPVVDTARAILDGHLVLSRELAQRGHYPAIDVPASLSRIMDGVVAEDHLTASRAMRALIADFESNRDLVLMGAYREGADAGVDRAMAMHTPISAFLAQGRNERSSLGESAAGLLAVMQDDG